MHHETPCSTESHRAVLPDRRSRCRHDGRPYPRPPQSQTPYRHPRLPGPGMTIPGAPLPATIIPARPKPRGLNPWDAERCRSTRSCSKVCTVPENTLLRPVFSAHHRSYALACLLASSSYFFDFQPLRITDRSLATRFGRLSRPLVKSRIRPRATLKVHLMCTNPASAGPAATDLAIHTEGRFYTPPAQATGSRLRAGLPGRRMAYDFVRSFPWVAPAREDGLGCQWNESPPGAPTLIASPGERPNRCWALRSRSSEFRCASTGLLGNMRREITHEAICLLGVGSVRRVRRHA